MCCLGSAPYLHVACTHLFQCQTSPGLKQGFSGKIPGKAHEEVEVLLDVCALAA